MWKTITNKNVQSSSGVPYTIELSKWGIIQGIPSKGIEVINGSNVNCYADSDYAIAKANVVGLNNALAWAYSNNYNYVLLPRGNYTVCYPNTINTQADMTIDFNGSTLKVIYDSVKRSPYDNSTNAVYSFGGTAINCNTPNTHIQNLTLIGDRIDRDWFDPAEASQEVSKGINIGAGGHKSSIRYCKLGWFMADAVVLSYGPYTTVNSPGYVAPTDMEYGSLDEKTGQPITGATANTVRYKLFYDLGGAKSFSMIGLGYAPQTTIPTQQFNVYYYKADGTFVSVRKLCRTRDLIWTPKDATKIKISWEGDGTLDGGAPVSSYWHLLINDGVPDNLLVEYCEIHHCHRGGMFLGSNNTMIRKNYFHDTGMSDTINGTDIDGLPTFKSSTRYAIDIEDNVGQNCKINENVFENIRQAIDARGEHIEIAGNEFRNCGTGILLYRQRHAIVKRNYFYNSSMSGFEFTSFDRDWMIDENIFYGSSVSIPGTGTITSISNNRFHSSSNCGVMLTVLNFKDNVFDNSQYSVLGDRMTVVDNCIFINGSSINCTGVNGLIYDKIKRCKFIGGSFIKGQTLQQIIVRDSEFKDSYYQFATGASIYTYINCIINNQTQPLITCPSVVGIVNYTLELQNCTVNLGLQASTWKASTQYNVLIPGQGALANVVVPSVYNGYYYTATDTVPTGNTVGNSGVTEPNWSSAASTGATIIDNGIVWTATQLTKVPLIWGFNWGKIIITNSTINWNIYTNYTKGLLDNYGSITDSIQIKNSKLTAAPAAISNVIDQCADIQIDSASVFTNVSLTSPSVEIQSDKMANAPKAGTFAYGQIVYQKNPASSAPMGWININNAPFSIANASSWAAATTYIKGAQINTGGRVFQAQTAGKSVGTMPTFPATGLGSTIQDTTSVLTWQPNTNYVVGNRVLPTIANLFYFEVTSTSGTGTSGITEPTWNKTSGLNTVDNSGANQITWTARPIITWQDVGPLATFTTWGTIN